MKILPSPEPATWEAGVPNSLQARLLPIREGYLCGTYSYKIRWAEYLLDELTSSFTVSVLSEKGDGDEGVLEIRGVATESFVFRIVAEADNEELMDPRLWTFESEDITVVINGPHSVDEKEIDKTKLTTGLFSAGIVLLCLTCLLGVCQSKYGKQCRENTFSDHE